MQDCIVIGGGLIGMMTARELNEAGASVILLERNRIGQESSWAGGGILSPLYPWRYDDAVSKLASISQAGYQSLCNQLFSESGIDPEWIQNGLLILDAEEKDQALVWANRFNASMEVLSSEAIHTIEPVIITPFDEALWMPDVAQVRNPRIVKALHGSLKSRGVTIKENVEVTRLLQRNGKMIGVETRHGDIEAGKVIVAGGAWSGQLMAEVGCSVDIKPVRGQMILYQAEPDTVHHIILNKDRYLIPRRDGRVLVGSTLEDVGFEKTTTESAKTELQSYAEALVPALRDFEIEHHWSGLRPGTPKGIPYISEHPGISGLFINAGHFRNGVVLGLASARLMCELALGYEPSLEPSPYYLSC